MAKVTCPQIKVFHWSRTKETDLKDSPPSTPAWRREEASPTCWITWEAPRGEKWGGGSWLSSWTIQDYPMEERPGPFISHLNASTPPHVPLLHALLCRIHSSSLGFFLCLSSCMSSLTWFAPLGIPESFQKLVK